MSYHFNPHSHVKIWLTNNPDVFMNFENQTRLIEIREKNPNDTLHLLYDSTLLSPGAHQKLHDFCAENNIIPVDADSFKNHLKSDLERSLYDYYKDEINNLKQGGNLAVASDILRVLSVCYRLGIYTDLDVSLDTNGLPDSISVDAPFLLNIGSLKLLGNQEMILALNELIIVADEEAAKEQIEKLQAGLLSKLKNYSSDYIEQTEAMLDQGKFLNRTLVGYMKNRVEANYIKKSAALKPGEGITASRMFRAYINEIMTNEEKYLNFHKQHPEETHETVIKRLRDDLKQQISFIKWLFFNKEYNEINQLLSLDDGAFIKSMMKKERTQYLKSIVICTTGPVEVARSFFGGYILTSDEVEQVARPVAFSHYGLDKAFLSRNVIPLHENAWGMLKYLGEDVGVRNDSSWLEEGVSLQEQRNNQLLEKKQTLSENLPSFLLLIRQNINEQITNLQDESKGFFRFLKKRHRKAEKIEALQKIMICFDQNEEEFDIAQFRTILADLRLNHKEVFAGFFFNRTRKIIEGLEQLCHDSIVLRVAKNKKLGVAEKRTEPVDIGSGESTPKDNIDHDIKKMSSVYVKQTSTSVTSSAHCYASMYPVKTTNSDVIEETQPTATYSL